MKTHGDRYNPVLMNKELSGKDHTILDTIQETLVVPLHPAGMPFVAGGALIALLSFLVAEELGWLFTLLTLFCLYFFRDPPRVTPQGEGIVVSPADGKVVAIKPDVPLPAEIAGGDTSTRYTQISIFLSVFDVHVNRIPIGGIIRKKAYMPGKFVNAALDKASVDNERAALLIGLSDGRRIGLVQIAGLVARRIITDVKEGDSVESGAKYGIIRFGSRADVYLPAGVTPLVCVGQRAVGGETRLADLNRSDPMLSGKTH